jgi:DnaK suppressor protein
MSDETTTAATSPEGSSDHAAAALQAQVRPVLLEQVERSEKQLLELESDMDGMLREHDTIQEDLDQARTVLEGIRADLQRAQRAIARIDAGTFGQCVDCRNQIAPARLEAIPEAERCSTCA